MINRRRLIENIVSLGALQAANYILPFVTLPYLVRVLGPAHFGLLAFAQAFVQYFVVLTDYGFNLSATRQIAVHRADANKVSQIFCSVMLVKTALMVISWVLMSLIVFLLPRFRVEWAVYHVTFLTVLGSVLFPSWFFQGMERMKYITGINVGTRAVTTASIFLLVHTRSDYVMAALIQSLGWVLAGVLGLLAVRRLGSVQLEVPSRVHIGNTLREGWHIFVAQIASTLFGPTNVFLLGFFVSPHIVGYYSIAQKIVRAVILLCVPINTAVYPRVSQLFSQSRELAIGFLRKLVLAGGMLFLLLSVSLFVGAEYASRLVLGTHSTTVSSLIRIMSIIPLSVFLDGLYGTQVMLNLGMEKQFGRAVLYAAMASLVLSLSLIPISGAYGAAIAYLLSQLLALLLMAIPVHRTGIVSLSVRRRRKAEGSDSSDGVGISPQYAGSMEEVR